jgi:hypothetical protein
MALTPIVVSALASFASILATDEMLVSRDGSEVRRVTVATVFTSPALLGTPTAPTPTAGDSSTKIATTAFVSNAVGTAIGGLTTDDIEDVSGLATASPPTLTSALLYLIGSPTFTGNVTVQGNLTVNGTLTSVDTDNLQVEDSLIKLARSNVVNTLDIGFYGQYQPAATPLFAGLDLDCGDGKFYLWKDLQVEPTTTVDRAGTGYTAATLVVNSVEHSSGSKSAPSITFSGDTDLGFYRVSANSIGLSVGNADAWRVDSSQRHIFASDGGFNAGLAAAVALGGNGSRIHIFDFASGANHLHMFEYANGAGGVNFYGAKTRSTTVGTFATVNNSDNIFRFGGYGDDGAAFREVGRIQLGVHAAPSSGIVPGRWDISVARASDGAITQSLRVSERVIVGTTTTDNGTDQFQVNGGMSVSSGNVYKVNAVQVVKARITGWAVATGTPTRTTFDTTTVTLPQLAERVKALIDDLHGTAGHGLIGT